MANRICVGWGDAVQRACAALLGLLGAGLIFGCSSSTPSAAATAGSAGAAGATGSSSSGSGGAGAPALSGVTFHKDVEPILQRSCQSCHVAGGIAPFPLMTFADSQPYGALMVDQTANRIMPPWHALNTDECTVPLGWKDDTRLTDDEIAVFKAWSDGGSAEGDPNDAPKARAAVPGLPGVQLELQPATPYTLAPGGDEFRCFVLDPKLSQDSFVNGVFVVPGNSAVVHHVLVFTDPDRSSLALADGSMSYDCFGGAGVDNADLLTAWTPGGVPMEYPSNIAAPVKAGSLLVMQVHYHPHSAVDVASDATRLQLRFSDSAPAYNAVTALIGNFKKQAATGDGLLPGPDDPASGPVFLIPANAKAHTETMQLTFSNLQTTAAPRLYAIGGHMHYVGVDEKVTLTRANGDTECLMQIPHWDFDWQRRYDYDAPIDQLPVVHAGDKLTVRCTYDNTMGNDKLATSLLEQGLQAPQDVKLGESTLDEMCLVSLTALYPAN